MDYIVRKHSIDALRDATVQHMDYIVRKHSIDTLRDATVRDATDSPAP